MYRINVSVLLLKTFRNSQGDCITFHNSDFEARWFWLMRYPTQQISTLRIIATRQHSWIFGLGDIHVNLVSNSKWKLVFHELSFFSANQLFYWFMERHPQACGGNQNPRYTFRRNLQYEFFIIRMFQIAKGSFNEFR